MSKLGIQQFLDHSGRGGGGSVLNWKDEGRAKVWLHPGGEIHAIWGHLWYQVVETEDTKTREKVKRVFRRRFVCHERELINKKSRFRDKKRDPGPHAGSVNDRDYPPMVCPMDFMVEAIIVLVREGKISWTDPVFEFKGDDPKFDATLTAGGLYGAFKNQHLTKEENVQIRRAGIDVSEGYKEDVRVKLNYLFQVIADPSEGIIAAIEPSSLKEKLVSEWTKKGKRAGRDKGDPFKNPYPFEWLYDDKASFDDMYEVTALDEQPDNEVLALFKDKPPSVEKFTEVGDCLWLYDSMREYCVLEDGLLDFDAIFKPAREAGLMVKKEAEEEHDDKPFNHDLGDEDAGLQTTHGPASEELYECDHCNAKVIRENDTRCSACGTQYDEDNNPCARPCNECKTIIQLEGDGPWICPKCAAIHKLDEKESGPTAWVTTKKGHAPEVPKEEKPRKRTKGAATAKEEAVEKQSETKKEAKAEPAKEAKPAKRTRAFAED